MRYLEKAVTIALDHKRCNGCGMCLNVCPHGVFRLVRKRAVLADRGACMECGACANNCEPGAIFVRAGVGCAAAVITGKLTGTEPTCGCSNNPSASCC
jgi:NAD-dependent dihydropyrimidine dehydrogenase PreA subunit